MNSSRSSGVLFSWFACSFELTVASRSISACPGLFALRLYTRIHLSAIPGPFRGVRPSTQSTGPDHPPGVRGRAFLRRSAPLSCVDHPRLVGAYLAATGGSISQGPYLHGRGAPFSRCLPDFAADHPRPGGAYSPIGKCITTHGPSPGRSGVCLPALLERAGPSPLFRGLLVRPFAFAVGTGSSPVLPGPTGRSRCTPTI